MKKAIFPLSVTIDSDHLGIRPVTRRLMLPLGLLYLVFSLGIGVLVFHEHEHLLYDNFKAKISQVEDLKERLIETQAMSLGMAIKPMINHPETIEALRRGDSTKLMMLWRDTYLKMNRDNGLSHFYFLDKNRVCFLRIHNPAKKGDRIDRFTAQEAEWNRKPSYGIEIGPLGTLTLRYIEPVIVNNELIGYIELGKEIEDILEQLHSDKETEVALFMKKEYLTQKSWEHGMKMLGRDSDWSRMKRYAMIYTSMGSFPQDILRGMDRKMYEGIDVAKLETSFGGESFRFAPIPFQDVSGRNVGEMVILSNVTYEKEEFLNTSIMGAMGLILLSGFVIGVIYFLLRRSDEKIRTQRLKLDENRLRYEQIARHSRTMAWEVDATGKYTYISSAVLEVLGYESEEVIGLYFYDLHPSKGRETFKASALEAFELKKPFVNLKNRVLTKEGKTIWVLTNAMPILDASGRLLGYRGSDTDIDEWQRSEEAIIASKNLMESIIETIPMAIFWKNSLLEYQGCNTRFAVDSGKEHPEQIIGKNDYDLYGKEEADRIRSEERELIRSQNGILYREEPIVLASGKTIWSALFKVVLRNKGGEIDGVLGIYQDITERKSAETQINTLAFYDPLTSLPNRTLLIDRLRQSMAASDRSGQYGGLLLIDLDNFKILNDTVGHEVGDRLLMETASRLKECLREEDTLSRIGGDEFMVMIWHLGTDSQSAALACEAVAEKILATLNVPYSDYDGAAYRSSASIGITLYHGDGESAENLFKQAELAMYRSKETGRNSLSFFDPQMESSLKARTDLEDSIRKGIENGEFLLYYQPQVNGQGKAEGVEALVRWNHPQRGMISPAEFIPIAEASGLILPLGREILIQACRQLKAWESNPLFSELSMAVNVSVRQFAQSQFAQEIRSILKESGANPALLKIEVTESMFAENIDEITAKMEELRALGIRFSIDDYGTGYSSLGYLKRLPLDQLKIDQGFVRDIFVDKNDETICRSTIALAKSMKLSVIAEGVETQEQFSLLLKLGCDAFQGYWFGRPMNAKGFEEWQQDHNEEIS